MPLFTKAIYCAAFLFAFGVHCFAKQLPDEKYSFSLRQAIQENNAAFKDNDNKGQLSLINYFAAGMLFLHFDDRNRVSIKCIYTDSYSLKSNSFDTVSAFLDLNTGAINRFYTCRSTGNKQLSFLKKLLSFIQIFNEQYLKKTTDPVIENFYDGVYEASYLIKEKNKQYSTYVKNIKKADNNNLRNTRTIMDEYDASIRYFKQHLNNITIKEKKRQKFGNSVLSNVETIFQLYSTSSIHNPRSFAGIIKKSINFQSRIKKHVKGSLIKMLEILFRSRSQQRFDR